MGSSLTYLPIYLLYAAIGTGAAAAAKIAMAHVLARRWWACLPSGMIAGGLVSCNFALLGFLLSRIDMSVAAPMAIGVNLLMAAVLARLLFRETLDGWKIAGMLALLAGVGLLAWA
ncbi:MAG: hypothetical protein ACOVKO_02535 [Elstera sp.]